MSRRALTRLRNRFSPSTASVAMAGKSRRGISGWTLPRDFAPPLSASHRADVMERISSGEMPPEDEPKPKAEDAARVVEWMEGATGSPHNLTMSEIP
jgi:hypothetical protein